MLLLPAGQVFFDGGEDAWPGASPSTGGCGDCRRGGDAASRTAADLTSSAGIVSATLMADGAASALVGRASVEQRLGGGVAMRAARLRLGSRRARANCQVRRPMAGKSLASPASEKSSCAGRVRAITIACRCRARTAVLGKRSAGLLRQQLRDHAFELLGRVGGVAADRLGLGEALELQHLGQRLGAKRRPAGKQRVHHAAEAVLIAAGGDRPAVGLLGRHVVGGAQHAAGGREAAGGAEQAGDAEVGELHVVARRRRGCWPA